MVHTEFEGYGCTMLQIVSGRFFGSGPIEEMESDAILYSNLTWILPIRTKVMELRPADLWHSAGLASYVLRYTNRHERRPGDALVLAAADEAVDQFRLLASFWFKAFFHPDRTHVEILCRSKPRSPLDAGVPRSLVPRFFSEGLAASASEAEGLVTFVAKVLAMPRQKYRLALACVAGFFNALETIGTNFELGYSLLVYVLEALGQGARDYIPTWPDYEPLVKDRLDPILAQIDSASATQIRSALLSSAQPKLTKRFVGFVTEHVTNEFFTTGAEGVSRAVPRSQLERALLNLYKARSGFVHELRKVRQQIRYAALSGPTTDLIVWQHEPYLTMAGLVRLTHHVLTNFIARQEVLESEDWPEWRSELPGLMRLEMAPQYWIWQAEGFTAEQGPARLAGLLSHLLQTFGSKAPTIPNMAPVMEMIELLVPTCRGADRPTLVVLYLLYHSITGNLGPESEKFLRENATCLEGGGIEMLAVWPLLHEDDPEWGIEGCVAVFENYMKRRYRPHALSLPLAFEISIMAQIANRFLAIGDAESFIKWVDRSTLEAAGRRDLQDYMCRCKAETRRIDPRVLLGIVKTDGQPETLPQEPTTSA